MIALLDLQEISSLSPLEANWRILVTVDGRLGGLNFQHLSV